MAATVHGVSVTLYGDSLYVDGEIMSPALEPRRGVLVPVYRRSTPPPVERTACETREPSFPVSGSAL